LIKVRNKRLAMLLVCTMLMTMFIGVGTASAATEYYTVTTPTVLADGNPHALGTILIDIDVLVKKTDLDPATYETQFLVRLPADVSFNPAIDGKKVLTVSKNEKYTGPTAGDGNDPWEKGTDVGTAKLLNDKEIRVDVDDIPVDMDDVRLQLNLNAGGNPTIAADRETGPIDVTITNIAGQFSSNTVTVANVAGGAVKLSVVDDIVIEDGKTNTVEITIQEDSEGGLKEGTGTLKFKLPRGFEWAVADDTVKIVKDGKDSVEVKKAVTATDGRTLEINRTKVSEPKSIYRISANIDVIDDEADFGEVEVSVSGKSTYSPSTLVVGTYTDYGYAIEVADPDKTIIAGRTGDDAEISKITIQEEVKGSLLDGRTIIMELPDGCEWGSVTPKNKGGVLNASASVYTNSPEKVKLSLTNNPANKGKMEIEAQIKVAVNYTGPITVDISGSAGIDEEITVAEVIAPITAECDPVNVIIGAQDQPGADIIITETVAGAIADKSGDVLTLTAPAGVSFSKLPTVASDEIKIGTVTRGIGADGTRNNVLNIPIKSGSDKAGTITISNLYYTIDRTVAEGPMKITIGGSALNKANIANRGTAATVVAANNVTSAGAVEKYKGSFVIGSTTYTLNGVEQTMDVAPYIKGDRTYMPIRYVAYALGIDDNNIVWDQANQTVTLMKGDKVVQMKIGSTALLINGASITMDVAPEISNDRTMLPIRFVAQAFGAPVAWDEATQTVTVN
jgi:hypothetical protein